jgi:hypothetical protein
MKVDVERLIAFLMSDEVIENNIPESLRLGLKEQGLVYDAEFGFVEMKFKIGDRVKQDGDYITHVVEGISDDCYVMVARGTDGHKGQTCYSRVYFQDQWKLAEPVKEQSGATYGFKNDGSSYPTKDAKFDKD